jgi:hypothetical protein
MTDYEDGIRRQLRANNRRILPIKIQVFGAIYAPSGSPSLPSVARGSITASATCGGHRRQRRDSFHRSIIGGSFSVFRDVGAFTRHATTIAGLRCEPSSKDLYSTDCVFGNTVG